MAEVALRNIVKTFDRTPAVAGIDLDITDREFVVLVGPSGCGKSTVLRMIAGLEDVTEGQVLIGGRVVNDMPPKDRDIAMVFQNYALYPHMTVKENMAFSLKLARPAATRQTPARRPMASLAFEHVDKTFPGGTRALADVCLEVEDLGGLVDLRVDLVLRSLCKLEREAHVLAHGHVRVERVVLEHHRDVAVLRLDVVDDLLVNGDRPPADLLEPGEHAQQRRLAAPRGADQDGE